MNNSKYINNEIDFIIEKVPGTYKFVEAKTGNLFKSAKSLLELGSDGKKITKQLELISDLRKAGEKVSYELVTPYNLNKKLKADILEKAKELGLDASKINIKQSK